jgi:hypothetical protein
MDKKAFLFYYNWEQQVDLMTDQELRRFIKNLCRHAKGEPVELPTREENLCWLGIVPALEINKTSYEKKVKANQENGKLGGAPVGNQNARKDKTTQINPDNLLKENREIENENCEKVKDNSKLKNENWEKSNENIKKDDIDTLPMIVNPIRKYSTPDNSKNFGGISMAEFNRQRGINN